MFARQHCKCLICETSETSVADKEFALDHCHQAGRIRGILCSNCNLGLGGVHDNLDILEQLREYLSSGGPHVQWLAEQSFGMTRF
jgi:hypothetical protein